MRLYIRDGDRLLCTLCRLPIERLSEHECPVVEIVEDQMRKLDDAMLTMAESADAARAGIEACGRALQQIVPVMQALKLEQEIDHRARRVASAYWKRYVRRSKWRSA